ncbi:MAG: ATP synthase subunit I [Acidimicrobiales bacterium]
MSADPYLTRFEGPSPVAQIARDIVRRGLWAAPVMMGIGAAIWSTEGFFSVGYGMILVLANFAIAAGIIAATSRISLALLMGGVMFGFLIRLGVIFLAVYLVRDAGWIDLLALGLTIIITHLGLLFWELRYVSLSMAYPGLKPGVGGQTTESNALRPVVTDLAVSTDQTDAVALDAAEAADGDDDNRDNEPTDTNKEHSQP